MSEHKAIIRWSRESRPFDYENYPRDHTWSVGDALIEASAAPEYLGSESRVDPEQAFVAAISSCHMLTFLAIAAKQKLMVDAYEDQATGYLTKNESGRLAVTRVVLKPIIEFAEGVSVTPERLEKLHGSAHRNCFIANSVQTDIEVES